VLFATREFAVFLALVFAVHWLFLWRHRRLRTLFLLAASYVFYGWWDWRFLGLITFTTALDWVLGLAMGRTRDRRARKRLLLVSLVANLGVLGLFKYWDFFASELAALLAACGLPHDALLLNLVLPVGISFFTFQSLSYTIDVYRGELEPERDLASFALFVAFFPQLVAGPIVRARDFLPQIQVTPRLDQQGFERALALIACGLFKKAVLADSLGALLVDPFWDAPGGQGTLAALCAVWGYAFQIYGDFSGYSDVAQGTARLFGYELCPNFDAPYLATSPRDFWRRWHLSLSTWLRDYLYVPLGGSRRGPLRTYVNLALTMLLGGLWHGASTMFVAWGGYHGGLLALDRWLDVDRSRSAPQRWIARLLVFHLVCLGWVFFRSPDAARCAAVLDELLAGAAAVDPDLPPLGIAALLAAVALHLPSRAWKDRLRRRFVALPALVQGACYAAFLGLLTNVQQLGQPFIYFQF
jgi:D-alanyl-lipoteichoic acid acyltransferase DltB (MBOAT superfamily)